MSATPPPARPREAGAIATRLEWLFRDALRRRQIHPLMALVRRYRDGGAG